MVLSTPMLSQRVTRMWAFNAPPLEFLCWLIIQLLEKSLVETDPEIAEIMVSDCNLVFIQPCSDKNSRNWRFNVNANRSSSSLPKMLPPAPSSMLWDRPCPTSTPRDTQERDITVGINILTRLSWLAKLVLSRLFIWILRNGVSTFNA
jgi:hypothetical protein